MFQTGTKNIHLNTTQEGWRRSLWSEGRRKGRGASPHRKQNCGFCFYFCLCLILHENWLCVGGRKSVGDRQGVNQIIMPPVLVTCIAEQSTELSIPTPEPIVAVLKLLPFSFTKPYCCSWSWVCKLLDSSATMVYSKLCSFRWGK